MTQVMTQVMTMDLRELGAGVYACLQEDRGLGTSNSGLVARGGGLVVDTFWDLPHTRELIAIYARVAPAPAAGDVIVHLPAARVVFAGDVLFRLCTPIGWDGTYAGWHAALDTIVALDPAVVVPGHGPLCGLEGPREMQAYLAYVRAESR